MCQRKLHLVPDGKLQRGMLPAVFFSLQLIILEAHVGACQCENFRTSVHEVSGCEVPSVAYCLRRPNSQVILGISLSHVSSFNDNARKFFIYSFQW